MLRDAKSLRVYRPSASKHIVFGYVPYLFLGDTFAKIRMRHFNIMVSRIKDFSQRAMPGGSRRSLFVGLKHLLVPYHAIA